MFKSLTNETKTASLRYTALVRTGARRASATRARKPASPTPFKNGDTQVPSARQSLKIIQTRSSQSVVIISMMELSKCVPSDDVNLTMAVFGEEVVVKQVEQEVSELLKLCLSRRG